ncbi:MAG: hypothetical protein BRD50_04130 [Bacteroidetes bacterium SW_11_45_7]|nr:MAG: hypothetical protein BRD50_04130 [Bacteroidetes bacterium SW_11_45_7]
MLTRLKEIWQSYQRIKPAILNLIIAQLFLNLINASFFLLFNYFLAKNGYEDHLIANIVSYRFLAIMAASFPLGLFIKGRHLKPFFYFASIVVPLASLSIIYAATNRLDPLLYTSMVIWGVAFTSIRVTSIPFILLNSDEDQHSEGISLHFQTFSLSIFTTGLLSFFLKHYVPGVDEAFLLKIFSVLGFASVFFVWRISIQEKKSDKVPLKSAVTSYDWGRIVKVLIPTLIIAVGAGFTIPFINLFFYKVHGMDSDFFSLLSSLTYLLVVLGVFVIPTIKRRFGYKVAITLIQSLAILMLILLASTEFYSNPGIAVYLAVVFYSLRQPLMNVAGPMTQELMMYYVGRQNRELVSALNASIWAGSWFISSQIFRGLRAIDVSYAYILLLTAALYAIGVLWHYFIILEFYRRKREAVTP